VLTWFGALVLLAIGLPLTGAGLPGAGTSLGRNLLCGGLILLVSAAGARRVPEAGSGHRGCGLDDGLWRPLQRRSRRSAG